MMVPDIRAHIPLRVVLSKVFFRMCRAWMEKTKLPHFREEKLHFGKELGR